jgi:hypothetical protein
MNPQSATLPSLGGRTGSLVSVTDRRRYPMISRSIPSFGHRVLTRDWILPRLLAQPRNRRGAA